jgi:hypothetical protein
MGLRTKSPARIVWDDFCDVESLEDRVHPNGAALGMARKISSKDLQDFVEGRLSKKDQARVQAFLRRNLGIEKKIEALRKQADLTRELGKLLLDEPVPSHLLDFVNSKRRTQK